MIVDQASKTKADRCVDAQVQLRAVPYPYRAMLAVCSDLDETPDRHTYWEIMRFLNTTEQTAMGPGVGLEVGNTIYFDMPPDQFAYWNTDDAGREMVRTLIRSGHIDCLHSYGDLATTRQHAQRALDELTGHDCKLKVWIDHGTAPTNLDPDIMQGHGDEVGHPAYHADLTTDYGIEYVWRGRVTSLTGQDVPPRFLKILRLHHPIYSMKTMLKEIAKHCLSLDGNSRYSMHRGNRLIRSALLRNGAGVQEFIRYNSHWGGPGKDSKPEQLAEVLSRLSIEHVLKNGGIGVLYTHLGKMNAAECVLSRTVVDRFKMISDLFRQRQLLVCTTQRLLQYVTIRDHVRYQVSKNAQTAVITIESIDDPIRGPYLPTAEEVAGLTFAIRGMASAKVMIGESPIENATAREGTWLFVAVPWHRLSLPQL